MSSKRKASHDLDPVAGSSKVAKQAKTSSDDHGFEDGSPSASAAEGSSGDADMLPPQTTDTAAAASDADGTAGGSGRMAVINPYSRERPPLVSQLFVPPRTKNRGNFLCVRLIAPSPLPGGEAAGDGTAGNGRAKVYSSDEAVGAWCTKCGDAVWWRKGESNGISRHMARFHHELLQEAGIQREGSKGKAVPSSIKNRTIKKIVDGNPAKNNRKFPSRNRLSGAADPLANGGEMTAKSCSAANQATFDALTLLWIHQSLRPFSIVEDSGLRTLISFASAIHGQPALCPDQRTMASWSSKLYENCTQKMHQLIRDQAEHHFLNYSITADTTDAHYDNKSTSRDDYSLSFYVIAIHFVTAEFELKTLILQSGVTEGRRGDELFNGGGGGGPSIVEKWGLERFRPTAVLYGVNGFSPFSGKHSKVESAPACQHVPSIGLSLHLICGPFYCPSDGDPVLQDHEISDDIADFSFDESASKIAELDHVKTIQQVVSEIRKISSFLMKLGPSASLQSAGEVTSTNFELAVDVPNRWSSTHNMLTRVLRDQSALEEILTSGDSSPTAEDIGTTRIHNSPKVQLSKQQWALAGGIWILITPFQSLVDSLSSETDPTMIYAYPFLCRVKNILHLPDLFRQTESGTSSRSKCGNFIKESLERFLAVHGDKDYFESTVAILEACQDTLRTEFEHRFSALNTTFLWASMLDPRLRKLNHCADEDERSRAKECLLEQMLEVLRESVVVQQPAKVQHSGEDRMTASSSSALNDMFGDVFDDPGAGGATVKLEEGETNENVTEEMTGPSQAFVENQHQQAENELNQYLAADSVPKNVSAFGWWRANHASYPTLALVARKWLSVLAVPTPHDRMVSNNGFVDRARTAVANNGGLANAIDENQWGLKLKLKSLELTTKEIADMIVAPAPPTPAAAATTSHRGESASSYFVCL
ncbi:hypothetical protein ACA910_008585 [Epithemia clementina (nom. ined.)]